MYLQEQLQEIRNSLSGIYPEWALAVFFLVLPLVELFLRSSGEKKTRNVLQLTSIAGGVILLFLVWCQWGEEGSRFNGMLFLDNKAVFYKSLAVIAWLIVLIHIRLLRYDFPAELYIVFTCIVLGIFLLCMSVHLLTVYLSVELISLSSYMLVSFSPRKKAAEGGMKYLLYGTVCSAVMLYGISFIYGLTGTLNLADPAMSTGLLKVDNMVLYTVSLLFFGGLLFKMSLVPFHLWAPDVYESAPTPLISFLSIAPKIGVLLCFARVLGAFPEDVFPLLGGIALFSMTLGNAAALWQRNFRRLMAYSSIAQAGYLLLGILLFSRTGFEAATFYLAVYILLNMAAFLLVDFLSPGSDTDMKAYSGFGRIHVTAAISITLIMVAFAGLPPTAGFTAKWILFSALWENWQLAGADWKLWLLVGGILNAAVSLGYYMYLPYLLFFKKRGPDLPARKYERERQLGLVSGAVGLIIVLIFMMPDLLFKWIRML